MNVSRWRSPDMLNAVHPATQLLVWGLILLFMYWILYAFVVDTTYSFTPTEVAIAVISGHFLVF